MVEKHTAFTLGPFCVGFVCISYLVYCSLSFVWGSGGGAAGGNDFKIIL